MVHSHYIPYMTQHVLKENTTILKINPIGYGVMEFTIFCLPNLLMYIPNLV